MENEEAKYDRVESPGDVAHYANMLMQYSGASLVLDKPEGTPLPVILVRADPGEPLLVDISSVREAAVDLKRGIRFRLMGQSGGKLLRTNLLTAEDCSEVDEMMQCRCPFPEFFEILQRRDSFRATLRQGLDCDVVLSGHGGQGSWDGKLKDLSMTGCLVELPLGAASMLASLDDGARLELYFPNGRYFEIEGVLRHEQSNIEQRFVRAGFEFCNPDAEQNRALWFFVREIERESARSAAGGSSLLSPSSLFQKNKDAVETEVRSRGEGYPTPMARNLAVIAEFLDTQILALRTGENIDSVQLSRQAERLLSLLEQDREGLLFAIVCLSDEPLLVRHCLGVAVHLVDMAGKSLPRDMRKAMMASAMVHDFGQVLLPAELLQLTEFTAEQEKQFQGHVDLLLPKLEDCTWLTGEIMRAIVQQANERLDGSGYPQGLGDQDLRELARMMAVVDEADRLSHPRPGQAAKPINVIHRHLLSRPSQFDPRWVKRFIQHFGGLPVGTLVRYEGGKLGWVRGLDDAGWPSRVQLTAEVGPPRPSALGDVLSGKKVLGLGKSAEVLVTES